VREKQREREAEREGLDLDTLDDNIVYLDTLDNNIVLWTFKKYNSIASESTTFI